MSMKVVVAFVAGVVVGIIGALMMAPKSGEELREELRREALAERERVKKEYTQAVSQMQERVDKVHGDVQEMLAQAREKGSGAADMGTETAVSAA